MEQQSVRAMPPLSEEHRAVVSQSRKRLHTAAVHLLGEPGSADRSDHVEALRHSETDHQRSIAQRAGAELPRLTQSHRLGSVLGAPASQRTFDALLAAPPGASVPAVAAGAQRDGLPAWVVHGVPMQEQFKLAATVQRRAAKNRFGAPAASNETKAASLHTRRSRKVTCCRGSEVYALAEIHLKIYLYRKHG
jgi:hypothetical protein